jgi:hypothetical protein
LVEVLVVVVLIASCNNITTTKTSSAWEAGMFLMFWLVASSTSCSGERTRGKGGIYLDWVMGCVERKGVCGVWNNWSDGLLYVSFGVLFLDWHWEVFCFEKKLVGLLLLNFAVSLFYF